MKEHINGFFEFIRKQGVMSLAIGFVLGGAVTKVVTALVNDIINPLVGLALGKAQGLRDAKFMIGESEILWGDFVSVLIDFFIITLVIYFTVKILRIEMDKKK